jgi:hypothetical protein
LKRGKKTQKRKKQKKRNEVLKIKRKSKKVIEKRNG